MANEPDVHDLDTNSTGTFSKPYSIKNILSGMDIGSEYADPEHICEECLPIPGDEIVGTRAPNKDTVTTVHRVGCPHAQRAINQAVAKQRERMLESASHRNGTVMSPPVPGTSIPGLIAGVDSVSLRMKKRYIWSKKSAQDTVSKYVSSTNDVPVRLHWSDLDDKDTLFFAEIIVHAEDRKLLLADCSEIVSELVEILRTGSSSSAEYATLVFLVKIGNVEQLQNLMDRLSQLRSVLSVERRFGSELM